MAVIGDRSGRRARGEMPAAARATRRAPAGSRPPPSTRPDGPRQLGVRGGLEVRCRTPPRPRRGSGADTAARRSRRARPRATAAADLARRRSRRGRSSGRAGTHGSSSGVVHSRAGGRLDVVVLDEVEGERPRPISPTTSGGPLRGSSRSRQSVEGVAPAGRPVGRPRRVGVSPARDADRQSCIRSPVRASAPRSSTSGGAAS